MLNMEGNLSISPIKCNLRLRQPTQETRDIRRWANSSPALGQRPACWDLTILLAFYKVLFLF